MRGADAMEEETSKDARSQLAAPVGLVITFIWATAAVVGLVTGRFQGLEVVTPVMVIFAGYLFGINIVRTAQRPSRKR